MAQADQLLERMREVAAESNNPFLRWTYATSRCTRMMPTKTGDEIEEAATSALRLGEEAGQPDAFTAFATQFALARLTQGRLAELVELVRQQVTKDRDLPQWRAALAANLARVGEHEEARQLVDELMTDPETAFPADMIWLIGQSYLGEAVSMVGTEEQASRVYEILAPYAGRFAALGAFFRRAVNLDLATLAARAGRRETAEQHFADAAEQHLQLDAPVWLAETYLRWGQFHLDGGDSERALSLLADARDLATRMNCVDLAAIAAAELSVASG
jgi:tetratricopeptide (TPR) repeat protein